MIGYIKETIWKNIVDFDIIQLIIRSYLLKGLKMRVIVSIASYDKRISTLYLCLETIFAQTFKPDKILIYLDKKYEALPFDTKNVEVRFVQEDLKSHNKYFYAMQQYPQDIIVTFDDDVLYPHNILSKLVSSYERFPNAVSAGRAHQICFDSTGNIMPYNDWMREATIYNQPRFDLMANGVGGVLYPPNCMSESLFDKNMIKKLCLYGDDIWLKAMQLIKGTPVVLIKQPHQHPPIIAGTQENGLYKVNKLECRNDTYIKSVFGKFGLTKERILL